MAVWKLGGPTAGRSRSLTVMAVVAGTAVLLAACGSSGAKPSSSGHDPSTATTTTPAPSSSSSLAGLYGSVPPAGTATTGGTITYGQVSGQVPTYIFPVTPSAQFSPVTASAFQNDLYLPLYASPKGSEPTVDESLSVAKPATYSNGNKTVTIALNTNYKWSSGAPVDAQDVVFFIDLVKAAVKESAADYDNYTPGFFPDNVASATATSTYTVTLQLTKAYNPGYFSGDQLNLLYALPSQSWDKASLTGPPVSYATPAGAKRVYDFLAKQAMSPSTLATSPLWSVVDGPAQLSSFTSSTGAYTLVPNLAYGGSPKMRYSELKVLTFTTYEAEFNALRAGTLDIGQIDQTDLPQAAAINSGYNVYGLPDFGFEAAFYNFKDTTGHFDKIIGQLYVRQALAHLEDQAGYIKDIFKGAGAPAYGPVPSAPTSPYAPPNATTPDYPYSVSAASQLLSSHGWKVVPNGQTTCQRPGPAANECGAGIPAGTPLTFNLFFSSQPTIIGLQVAAWASAAAQVGIKITPAARTFNFLIQNYDNPSAKSNENKWAVNDFGGLTNDTYPTANAIFHTAGIYNLGSYSDAQADALINASVFGASPAAVKSEAQYLTEQQPALFQPTPSLVFGASKRVGGDSRGFLALTQYALFPQFFYLTK